jgi:hypothetical protein
MTFGRNVALIALACAVAWTVAACGNDEEGPKGKQARDAEEGASVTEAAKQAMSQLFIIDDEFLEGRRMIEQAGFEVKSYGEFPTQDVTVKGRMLLYVEKRKKQSGVLYLKKTGGKIHPAWHWYFEDMVPDSVVKTEVNGDGLWDVRVVTPHKRIINFIQDDSFTLLAPERSDWIAMNGRSSASVSKDDALWKCFDGDTTTAWRSSDANGVFVELDVPFGVQDGVLRIAVLPSEQPERCVVYAGDKRIGEVEIEPVAGRQEIALDAGIRGAKKVRVEFPSVRGGGDVAAIAELGLR